MNAGGSVSATADLATPSNPIGAPPQPADPAATEFSPAEQRVIDALLACVSRWGLSKTTIEDVAREAGISRATIYRLFPGGKDSMVRLSIQAEVTRLIAVISGELAAAESLEDCLVAAMTHGTRFIVDNVPFHYLREHEPETFESYLAFDRLDSVVHVAGSMIAPSLSRFVTPVDAYDLGCWTARLVVSYLLYPDERIDLSDESAARHLVGTYMMPSLETLTESEHFDPQENPDVHR